MQRECLCWRMLRVVVLCCACLVLLAVASPSAQAQELQTIAPSESVRLVDEEYIPGAAQALGRRGHEDLAAQWEQASAGQPLFQYQLVGSEVEGYEILPRYILVPVEHGGDLIGLIGLEPYTGELGWRLDHVSPGAEWPERPGSTARSGSARP